jgi:hypothetical protein
MVRRWLVALILCVLIAMATVSTMKPNSVLGLTRYGARVFLL